MGWRQNPLLGYWKRGCEKPTAAEAALEPAIAKLGERYRHQYPFWSLKYFADFALLDRKIIIEVDGDSHDKPEQKEKDLLHELQVLELGWMVVRVTNEQALRNPEEAVQVALGYLQGKSPDINVLRLQLTEALARLHQNYPHLLAEAATRSKSRRQSGLKGAQKRRELTAAGVHSPRMRVAARHLPESQRPKQSKAKAARVAPE